MTRGHGSVKTLRRGELARLTGCNLETIRYYEKIGILPLPPRSAAGHRLYDPGHVALLRFVMRARELGFSLDEVRDMMRLVDGGSMTCADVKTLAEAHLERIRERIADLRRIEAVLSETVARCTGEEVPQCAVIEALQTGA